MTKSVPIRTHRSHAPTVKCKSKLPSMTEQSHAEQLEIRNMLKKGVRMSRQQPIWGDASNVPSLDVLLRNRRRLQQIYDGLPPRVKADLPGLDDLVRILKDGTQEDLVDVGLLDPKVLEEQPDEEAEYLKRMGQAIAEAVKSPGEESET